MSIEDSVLRLAVALERNQEGAAVAEIIRQRDEAIEMRRRTQNQCDWAESRKDKYWRELETERRRTRSLRVVIRKLKHSRGEQKAKLRG